MCDKKSTHIFMTKFTQNLQLAKRSHTSEYRLESIWYLLQRRWATGAWVLYRPIINIYTTLRTFSIDYSLTTRRRMIRIQWLALVLSSPLRRIDLPAICVGQQEVADNNQQRSWTIGHDHTGSRPDVGQSSPSSGRVRSRQQLSSSPNILISRLLETVSKP